MKMIFQKSGFLEMSYRFMRILVMFDLPTLTGSDKKEYRNFHKYLLKNGFIMMQESIYSKLALNSTVAEAIMSNVRKNKPASGLVQMITITEKQYSKMEFVVGELISNVIDSDERLIVI